jgi:hypothetical protein
MYMLAVVKTAWHVHMGSADKEGLAQRQRVFNRSSIAHICL